MIRGKIMSDENIDNSVVYKEVFDVSDSGHDFVSLQGMQNFLACSEDDNNLKILTQKDQILNNQVIPCEKI